MPNTTWSTTDKATTTLTGSNLIATSGGVGAWVRGKDSQAAGKFYWESLMTTWASGSTGIGLSNLTCTPNAWNVVGIVVAFRDGTIYLSGSLVGSGMTGGGSGGRVGIAVDITARLVWFRMTPSGNWNGAANGNPAGGTGGISIASLTGALLPVCAFAVSAEIANANFGDTAFSGTVPSGFTSGWPDATGGAVAQARTMVLA